MLVTVCQLPNDPQALEAQWRALCEHTRTGSDLVLLPEMPFHPWLAGGPRYDAAAWDAAVAAHETWIGERVVELGVAWVASSRPVRDGDRRHNRAFVWESGTCRDAYDKTYLPEEPGFWEASWYHPGAGVFEPVTAGSARAGFLLCTDLWFAQRGREYGKKGAQVLLVPRATEVATLDRWLVGGRALAIVSGCYVLSSNLCAPHGSDTSMGGTGFAIDPNGTVLARTTDDAPFATVEIDLALADQAKRTYPRYVKDPREQERV